MNTKLIIAADDFGLTRGVNEAIALAYRNGVVTSASLMVNGGAFESALELARINPGLDLGLHLNLTNHPLQLLAELGRGKIRRAELESGIRDQIERALKTGLRISHIDGHKHVHALPPVLKIVRRVAPLYGIKAIRSLIATTPGPASLLARNPKSRGLILKQLLLARAASVTWTWSWRRKAAPAMVAPDRLYGIAETGFLDLAAFSNIIHGLTPGVNELMCHPGYADDDLSKTPTRLRAQRERELALLTSREARKLIEDAGIQLISYRDLTNGNEE